MNRPQAVRELHTEFREAGAEVLQALTFYASRDKLATVGLERLARGIEPRRGPHRARGGRQPVPRRRQHLADLDVRARQRRGAGPRPQDLRRAAGGPGRGGHRLRHRRDVLVARRGADRGGVREEDGPADDDHRVLRAEAGDPDGKTAAECAKALVDAGADIVGINCLRGPELTLPDRRGDAARGDGVRRLPARRLPDDGRGPRLHVDAAVPLPARPAAALPQARWPTTRGAPGTSA